MSELIRKNTEFSEKFELQGSTPSWDTLEFAVSDVMLQEEVNELMQAIKDRDDIEVIDGACDVAVIALNIAYKFFRKSGQDNPIATANTIRAFERVLDSNLAKLHNGCVVRDGITGKVVKPDDWKAPDFEDLL